VGQVRPLRGLGPPLRYGPLPKSLRLEWKVNMYGAEFMESGKRQEQTKMCLRRRKSDASSHNPGRKAFSEIVASVVIGANLQARRLVQIAMSSNHQ
jgi:hypothetical protein